MQIIAPGATAITATPFVGNNVAKSASKGITLPSQNGDLGKIEADSIVQNIDSSDNEIVTPIKGEITELRTENAKHYRHEDGTYTAAVYPEPVHYMDSSGSWKDIDNTLTLKSVAGKATYTPAAAALDIRIPQDFSNNQMLTIGKDGYTVGMRIKSSDNLETMSRESATASSTINSAKAVINNNFESLQAVNTSPSTDVTASDNLKVEAENQQLMKLEKKVSAVNYNGILDGANLQYVITPSRVKENIIVTKTQDSYVYQFELALDGLTPVAQENGSINLYENIDDEEPLFTIEAPYMYDATEETSFNVAMSLNGNTLTVTADAEWINDANRKFPVVIDPTFSANTTTFYDATANQNTPDMNFPSFTTLYAGNGTLNLRRTYIKFTLPQLPEGSVVTESKLTLIQHDVTLGNSDRKLMAFDLTQKDSWTEGSITWNNQPVSNSPNAAVYDNAVKTLDYASFQTTNVDGRSYSFYITKAVKNWYEGSANNGIMITSDDESANSQAILYSSEHEDTTLHPSVTIRYNNNIGLEDYWSYETVDIGRAGSIYANPYNGSVTYVHSDLNMTGNLLPINISHVFNNNTSDIYTNEKGMPEDIVIDTLDNTLIHYNYDDLGRVESYSYGPVIRTITYRDTVGSTRTIARNQIKEIVDETKDGEILQSYSFEYESTGYLYEITETVDNQTINYYYDELGRLVDCTESADNFHTFTYDVDGNITSIGFGNDPIHTFTYSNTNWKDQLTAFDGKPITYDDIGNPLTYDGYTYTWERGTKLAGITGNGKNISYVYDSQGNRVQKTVNGVTTNYLYSGNLLMRQTDGTNTLDFQYDANGNIVGFIYNGTPYYYLRTMLNDVSGIVDGEGNVVAKYRYGAYGNIIYSTGDLAAINPIRYRGYYYDTETSWYYLQTRYYNPEWCRFISPDCLFIAGDALNGSNMYAYCNNDPVTYIDESGTAAEENIFVKASRPIVDAVTIMGWYIPEQIGNWAINKVLGKNSDDFSQFTNSNSFLSNLIFEEILKPFTMDFLYDLDRIIISPIMRYIPSVADWKDRTLETDKGLQYIIWPYTMAMGSRLGAFFLEFFPNSNGNYVTREGQYQWQHKMGYNWLYDAFFSLGGPIDKLVYDFTHTNTNNETKFYAVWCWKGDYWNLGPGAEIGIYFQEDAERAERGFYDIDKDNLKIKTHMKVDYNGKFDEIKQTNWWITMFMPWAGQRINLNDLHVWQAVSFDIPIGTEDENGNEYIDKYSTHDNLTLFNSFMQSTWSQKITEGSELNLKWGPTPPANAGWDYLNLDGSYYGNFQFYINF